MYDRYVGLDWIRFSKVILHTKGLGKRQLDHRTPNSVLVPILYGDNLFVNQRFKWLKEQCCKLIEERLTSDEKWDLRVMADKERKELTEKVINSDGTLKAK